jgi:UDP-N-acetylglucosamine 1-carboxyvinyltransferase
MNESLSICGGQPAKGLVNCGGSKNLVLKVIVASILTRSKCKIDNVPNILDVIETINLCKEIGAEVEYDGYSLNIDSTSLSSSTIEPGEVGSRMPVLYLSVLGHYFNAISVPLPKGCNLGARSIDFHLDILRKFGFEVDTCNGRCKIVKKSKLKGTVIDLSYPSVGATETALLLSVLAEGKSVIRGIAIEPEINCLILFLQHCGAEIYYTGDRELTIEGVKQLKGCSFKIAGDRLEAAGWACMACATDGQVEVTGIEPEHLQSFLGPFMGLGGGFEMLGPDKILFFRRNKILNPIFLETGPYPMFSTDYQPMLAILMSQANGSSVIHETLFDNRLVYLETLKKFGVLNTITDYCYGRACRFSGHNHEHSAVVTGNTKLKAPDESIRSDTIRSGFAYLIAASIADGTTEISNLKIIKRGIENLEQKLLGLGLDITTRDN